MLLIKLPALIFIKIQMIHYYIYRFALVILMLVSVSIQAQTQEQRQRITSRYNTSLLNQLSGEFLSNSKAVQQRLEARAKQLNIEVELTLDNGSYAELQKILQDGTPIYYQTYNVDAARSTRTNHLNIGGSTGFNLDGQNMTAYVWDGGHARVTHQEYQNSESSRVTLMDTDSEGLDLNFHAGHVTGTIMASGVVPNAKGMAPQAQVAGYKWNDDLAEATAAAAANGMLISNHSYGFRPDILPDYYFGGYIDESRNWDIIHYNAPYYLMVVAAGNDGNASWNGSPLDPSNPRFDKLTGHSTSKNNLVVANGRDANVDDNGELISVLINSGSSQGPTDDLRIKPDITGNGTGVFSTYANGDAAYNTISGTSMASPNVAGSALLLQQHSQNLFGEYMLSATLKGLILHTADDAGLEGPDNEYGWGLMNAKRAAEVMSAKNNGSIINDLSLLPGQSYTLEVESNNVDDLLASISWTDPAGQASTALNSDTPKLINDLDIVVEQNGNQNLPWRLTGVNSNEKGNNSRDNFERVDIENASGTYTITVSHKGNLTNGQQNFTLIVTGLDSEPLACEATPPSGITIGGVSSDSASLYWDNSPGGEYDFRYREEGATEWIETSALESNSINLDGLLELTTYEVQVRTNCVNENTVSDYSESVLFTTEEFVLSYCNSSGETTQDEYIDRVRLNQIDNTSGAGPGYSDFTSLSTDLIVGEEYTITINPAWTGTVYEEGIAVWIDFNLNGDFTDAGEQIFSVSPSTSDEISGNFTVPEGSVEGEVLRMRVSMKYADTPASCESFTYGEVEDYSVTLLEAGSCNVAAPIGETEQSFCVVPLLEDIELDTSTVVWYADETGGTPLESNYTISDGEILYAANIEGQCESTDRLAVTISIGDFEGPTPVIQVLEDVVGECEVTELVAPTAEDNCDAGEITGTTSVDLPITETTVLTWEFVDSSGNITTQTQNVVLEDTENPVIQANTSIVLELNDEGSASLSVEDIDTGSSDNCSIDSQNLSQVQFNCEDLEKQDEFTSVTYTVTDSSGNESETTIEVTLTDPSSACTLSSSVFDNADVSLYPNPVKQTLFLELGSSQVSIDKVVVYDIRGKQVMTFNMSGNTTSMDVSALASGNYFLMMSSGKDTLTKRFIKK